MPNVDDVVDDDEILPPRKQPVDPPAPKKQQQDPSSAPVATPEAPIVEHAKPAKRSPLARGTVTLGGVAVAGTLLAVVGAAAGPLALIATAAGTVLVPLAAWAGHNSRANRRGRGRGRGRQRNTRASWWPGGIGGGGKHGGRRGITGGGRGGSGLGPSGGRRSTGGARSGGIGGSRRTAGTGRGRTAAAGGGRSRAGLTPGRGRAGLGRPLGGRGGIFGGGRGRGRGLFGGGRGRGGIFGGRPVRGRRRTMTPRIGGAANAPTRTSRISAPFRGIGRSAAGTNRAGWRMGHAASKGAKQPTARGAFVKAYRNYGKNRPTGRTMTNYAARLFGGGMAGISAGSARFLTNVARRIGEQIRGGLLKTRLGRRLVTTPATQPAQTGQQQPNPNAPQPAPTGQQPNGQQGHPVPPPAFTQPAPPAQPGQGTSTPNPVPAGVGGGGDGSTGGNPMSARFPAHSAAVDFYSACVKWQPIGPNGRPSIWPLQDALPLLKDSVYHITNGYIGFVSNTEQTLEGGLHPGMRAAMADVWNTLVATCRSVELLEPTFNQVYADAIQRQYTRGRAAENV